MPSAMKAAMKAAKAPVKKDAKKPAVVPVAMKAAKAPAEEDAKKPEVVTPALNAALLAKAGKIGAWGAAVEHATGLKPKGENAVDKLAKRIYQRLRKSLKAGKAAKPVTKTAMKAKAKATMK